MDVRMLDDIEICDYLACMSTGISGYITSYISHMNYSMKKEFGHEMRKILPYINDEYEFLSRLKYMINRSDITHIRINMYIDSLMSPCSYLSDEGFDSIYNEFKEEIDEELGQLYEELLKVSDWGFYADSLFWNFFTFSNLSRIFLSSFARSFRGYMPVW